MDTDVEIIFGRGNRLRYENKYEIILCMHIVYMWGNMYSHIAYERRQNTLDGGHTNGNPLPPQDDKQVVLLSFVIERTAQKTKTLEGG